MSDEGREALREAAEEVVAAFYSERDPIHGPVFRLEAALAAGPPALPVLDVERLERAYANAEATTRDRARHGWGKPFWETFAAEYARLTEPQP
jgi:hypothetical protein